MTNTNLLQAMGRIDPKLIADAAPDVSQKKCGRKSRSWIKWCGIAACLCLIALVTFSFPSSSETVDTPELGEISRFTQEKLEERLIGLMQEEIYHSWKKPDKTFSEYDIWYLDNDGKEKVILYYDDNRCVSDIVFERDE